MTSRAKEHHVVGEGGESYAIAQLFDGDTSGDDDLACRGGGCEIEVYDIWYVHGKGHAPDGALESVACHNDSSGDAA